MTQVVPYPRSSVPQFVAPFRNPGRFKDVLVGGASITAIVYEMPFTVLANPYDHPEGPSAPFYLTSEFDRALNKVVSEAVQRIEHEQLTLSPDELADKYQIAWPYRSERE